MCGLKVLLTRTRNFPPKDASEYAILTMSETEYTKLKADKSVETIHLEDGEILVQNNSDDVDERPKVYRILSGGEIKPRQLIIEVRTVIGDIKVAETVLDLPSLRCLGGLGSLKIDITNIC